MSSDPWIVHSSLYHAALCSAVLRLHACYTITAPEESTEDLFVFIQKQGAAVYSRSIVSVVIRSSIFISNTAVRIRSAQQLHPLAPIYSRHSGLQTHYIMVCSSFHDGLVTVNA